MANILLIDDDPDIHKIVGLFLREDGHELHSVVSGLHGVDYAARFHPDLILLDVAMPGMDGQETFSTLKTLPETSEIPVMFLTVLERKDIDTEICKEGCVGYVQKPVDMVTLQMHVNKALMH